MKNFEIVELERSELVNINGGGPKEAELIGDIIKAIIKYLLP
jgi:hypothetical protein